MSRGGVKKPPKPPKGPKSAAEPAASALWPAANVVIRAIGEIRPNPHNSNLHTLEQIEEISRLMDQFGWTIPILVDETDMLIAGEGRLRAARLKGWTQAPVMTARGWTEEQKRAYQIADNQVARNSTWDRKSLIREIRHLNAQAYDLNLLAFPADELAKLVIDPATLGEAPAPTDVTMQRCPTCGALKRKLDT